MGTTADLQTLLQHESWARRLANALAGDEDVGADVLQDARVAFWRRPPDRESSVRAWLASVMRNAVRGRQRAARRERARDVKLLSEPSASAEDLVERLELHRLLATLVAGLRDPLREVLLLRYYEGLTAAEIGRRLSVPAGTVRWQLKTALDEIRRVMAERHDGDARVRALITPAASLVSRSRTNGPGAAPPPTTWLRLAMRALVVGGAAAIIFAAAVAVIGRKDAPQASAGRQDLQVVQRSRGAIAEARPSSLPRAGTWSPTKPSGLPIPRFLPASAEASGAGADQRRRKRVDLGFKDADVRNVLRLVATVASLDGVTIVLDDGVQGKVTIRMKNAPWDEVLAELIRLANLRSEADGDSVLITAARRTRAPRALTRDEVVAAMASIRPHVRACFAEGEVPKTLMLFVEVGEAGQVRAAEVRGGRAGTPAGDCAARAARAAEFRPNSGMSFEYPLRLE